MNYYICSISVWPLRNQLTKDSRGPLYCCLTILPHLHQFILFSSPILKTQATRLGYKICREAIQVWEAWYMPGCMANTVTVFSIGKCASLNCVSKFYKFTCFVTGVDSEFSADSKWHMLEKFRICSYNLHTHFSVIKIMCGLSFLKTPLICRK
jgi:hypothetical protein